MPVVSGDKLIKLLTKLGYEIVRQKGSHVRLRKKTEIGEHKVKYSNTNWSQAIADNRTYLASCLRHFAQILPHRVSDMLGTLSEMPAVALMEDDKDVEFG